ncbi:hypothetical protein HZH66_007721 [Vespula vulgaris]|uniref:Uncharacterized protein n=1 Tax=Vespula vulgaris TaxID=7454 RepID=A0A834N339_VESVU|nr:uncharacterized protein LOC127065844 isoform X3 [Vespula vulgaris]KAF7394547.1 hypothetical protein HZH66_007721 [Vespula vulgaris]
MADDPNRDILPVKEGSCIETCRSLIDPRERRLVCKLDRCQLEDKYLRLLEEASKLKKLSNCQEEKIKRLATKLMRVASNPRACVSLDFSDKNKLTALEVENSKLKNKLSVLRNQLLSHTMSGISPTRSRRPHTRPSSGLITCRSENSRIRAPSCQCIVESHQLRNDDNEAQNYLVKIEELETQKKEMSAQITQLEKELESYVVNNQKEKVVENIEYIKVWRQMKQLSDKLMTAQNTNESLNLQINDLKKILEETTKNNQEITVCLMAEKKRIAGIDGQIIKAKDSQLTLREKDEQIRDLINEMKILQQHNNELIALSSKYGQVELENVELKKKFTQQFTDQQNFKIAFNTEQANIVALQTANEQLLMKLQYLQKNMDTLMIQQLAIIQNDNKKHKSSNKAESSNDSLKTKNTQTEEFSFFSKGMTSNIQTCTKCFMTFDKVLQLEKGVNTIQKECNFLSKCVQTDFEPCSISINTKEGTSIMTSSDQPSSAREHTVVKHQEINQEKNPLSREKMLKLLEQVQISMPLKGGRIGQSDDSPVVEAMQDFSQRHRDADVADHAQTRDLKNLFATLVDVLRKEYSPPKNLIPMEEQTAYRNPPLRYEKQLVKDMQTDINNNDEINRQINIGIQSSTRLINKNSQYEDSYDQFSQNTKSCNTRESCSVNQDKLQNSSNQNQMMRSTETEFQNPRSCSMKRSCLVNQDKLYSSQNQVTKFTETGECSCTDSKKCHAESDCGYFCCTNYKKQFYEKYSGDVKNQDLKNLPSSLINRNDDQFAKKAADAAHAKCYDAMNPFESWKMNLLEQKSKAFDNNQNLQNYTEHLERCKELLDKCYLKNTNKIPVNNMSHLRGMGAMKSPHTCRMEDQIKPLAENDEESRCSLKCPNECIDLPPYSTNSTPLLITNGQGLVEIHVLSLQLATSAATVLFQEENLSNVSLFISWNIWGQETVCTPTLKYPKLNFNSSFVYHIPDLSTFFNYALSEYVIFQANVVEQNTTTYAVAKAKLCIKDILDYPQNKLHYIAPMNSVISCTLGMNFGQLSLWVRLSCDVEQVDLFKRQRGLLPRMEQDQQSIRKTTFREDTTPLEESNKEYEDAVDDSESTHANVISDINEKNKHEEIKRPSYSSTHDILVTHNDANNESSDSDITLLSKQSDEIARWATPTNKEEQDNNITQEEKTNMDEFNSFISHPLEKDTIIIQIVKINLFENSSVMLDDDVHLLYVEYSFLGYRGADMETESIPKPKTYTEPLIYNFRKVFSIDEEYHSIERNTLRAMLHQSINPNIKFILVSEPLPAETDIKDCVEIGYAYFNIREYALDDNDQSITVPIINQMQTEQIGLLTIYVQGLDAIRECLSSNM